MFGFRIGTSDPNPLARKVRRAGLGVRKPIAESEVRRFEAEAGVSIPEDYRDFLIRVANGGRPPCGLLPLAHWSASYWIDEPKPNMAGRPCVVTPESCRHGEDWLAAVGGPEWESRWENNEWDPLFGTIAVAEAGCGLFDSMIMTGEHRGRIFSWGDHASSPPRFYPAETFSEWLEADLDARIGKDWPLFFGGRPR